MDQLIAHHAGSAPSVWDTPWPWAGLGLVFFTVLALVAQWLLRPPRYRGRHAAPDWWFEAVEDEFPPSPVVVFLPAPPRVEPVLVDGPPGRHYVGWPAREVRQITEHTGEWAIEDLAEAMYPVELAVGGVR